MVGNALPTSKSVLPTVVTKKGTDYSKFALCDQKSRKSGERGREYRCRVLSKGGVVIMVAVECCLVALEGAFSYKHGF